MNQLALSFDAPSMSAAHSLGAIGMQRATDHAERDEPGFSGRAQAFILAYLAKHGTSSGELLTDACKLAGIRPSDDRAFGPVYRALSVRGQIVFAGYCPRAKGHGTAGGRLWRAAR